MDEITTAVDLIHNFRGISFDVLVERVVCKDHTSFCCGLIIGSRYELLQLSEQGVTLNAGRQPSCARREGERENRPRFLS